MKVDESSDSWTRVPLAELVFQDPEILKSNTARDYAFYYIDISSASSGKLNLPSQMTLFKDAPSRARKIIRRMDILMSTVRPNLKAFVYFDYPLEPCVVSTGFAVLRAKDAVDPRFVLHAILSDDVSRQIDSYVVGSSYPAINSTDVAKLSILTPSCREQKKIADVLALMDRTIEQTASLIQKYQNIKKGLMHDLLTNGVDESGTLRPIYESSPHLYWKSRLGWIPKGWEAKQLNYRWVMPSRAPGFKRSQVPACSEVKTLVMVVLIGPTANIFPPKRRWNILTIF